MADHAELIANFVAVSGAIPEQAQFYFEANSWDIDAVTSRFYEEPQAGAGSGRRDYRGASRVAEEDEDLDNRGIARPKRYTSVIGFVLLDGSGS
ncbi:hypothetical protein K457DRAFT_25219 [Linnemannia elongata AG-77]|uniref:Uncharacterized protein n=1 Tax=Linnemannia elongata AG-77 TaxID=1314771 RepID=A0A197JE56_9FUNG|nr:hypothetical protein K457DRAFT_25219 [Linnemannia elongata AG-77]